MTDYEVASLQLLASLVARQVANSGELVRQANALGKAAIIHTTDVLKAEDERRQRAQEQKTDSR